MAHMPPKMSQHPYYNQCLLTLLFGLVGAIVNFVPIELAFKISLVLGNTAYIVAASFLRPSFTLFCALISVIPLYFYWGHPFGFLTFGLEAWFISMLRARGWYVLTADLLYWLLIGMPLTAIIIWFSSESAQDFIIFSTLKQAINAVLYTSLASILLFTFNGYFQSIKSYQPLLTKSLPKWFLYSFWSISAFFVIVVSLLLSTGFAESQRIEFEKKLAMSNNYITHIGNHYLNEHQRAIQNIASELSRITDLEEKKRAILKFHSLYPGFLTMIVASLQGKVELASPSFIIEQLGVNELSVSDRPYFISAIEQKKPFVSSAFLGRGFGTDPIVAISAPIFLASDINSVSGVVEGSLNLGKFGLYESEGYDKNEIKIVVTDQHNKIIYASDALGLTTLSEFKYSIHTPENRVNLIGLKGQNNEDEMFIYKQGELIHNWRIYSLIEHSFVLKMIENMYLIIFLTLLVILLTATFFAKTFAIHLNRPLVFIMEVLSKARKTGDFKDIPYETPTEIQELYHELIIRSQALLDHQEELQDQVSKRTEELKQANHKLTEQANTDPLTGLFNRRYFNHNFEVMQSILARNHLSMMLAIIDLDLFKSINDTHGHLFGDYCLIEVAGILKKSFNRESDTVARFGGEEFVIISLCEDVGVLQKRFEMLRQQIAAHKFQSDLKEPIQLTISIGVAVGDANYSNRQEDWLVAADECLYHAKSNGRNQTKIKVLDVMIQS